MSKLNTALTKWRREKVMEYVAERKTALYIADKLQIPLRTVYRDIHSLEDNTGITDWLDKKLPFEYRKGLTAYDMLASKMWDIVDDDTIDPRVRVGAGNLIALVTDKQLSLIGGKDTLKRTVKLITTIKQKHNGTEIPQGLIPQNTKQTIVTEEQETRTITSDSTTRL